MKTPQTSLPPGYSQTRSRDMQASRYQATLAAGRGPASIYSANAALVTACCKVFGPTYYTEKLPAYYHSGFMGFAGGVPIP